MTKYEELDIAGLSKEELIAFIQQGDMLSIEGPVENERAVRFVSTRGFVSDMMWPGTIGVERIVNHAQVRITHVARPVPEVKLPTVPGFYEASRLPMSSGYNPYELRSNGQWYSNSCKATESRMRELMPLTRLVPETVPAKLADRLDPFKVGFRMDQIIDHEKLYETEGAELIAAIDNGELDK